MINNYVSQAILSTDKEDLINRYKALENKSIQAIVNADSLITELYLISLRNNWWWRLPLINIDYDDSICLEWWYGNRKITIYVSNYSIEYIKIEGNEMFDDVINLVGDLEEWWEWLAA